MSALDAWVAEAEEEDDAVFAPISATRVAVDAEVERIHAAQAMHAAKAALEVAAGGGAGVQDVEETMELQVGPLHLAILRPCAACLCSTFTVPPLGVAQLTARRAVITCASCSMVPTSTLASKRG